MLKGLALLANMVCLLGFAGCIAWPMMFFAGPDSPLEKIMQITMPMGGPVMILLAGGILAWIHHILSIALEK